MTQPNLMSVRRSDVCARHAIRSDDRNLGKTSTATCSSQSHGATGCSATDSSRIALRRNVEERHHRHDTETLGPSGSHRRHPRQTPSRSTAIPGMTSPIPMTTGVTTF